MKVRLFIGVGDCIGNLERGIYFNGRRNQGLLDQGWSGEFQAYPGRSQVRQTVPKKLDRKDREIKTARVLSQCLIY
jgi:hypothetical protein